MSVAYGYCRVSDEKQVESGMSLDSQKEACEQAYHDLVKKVPGLKWGGNFVDPAVSGTIFIRTRPAGAALQARLRAGDYVIAAKLDRCFRNLEDTIVCNNFWIKTGIIPHYLDIKVSPDDPMFIPWVVMSGIFAHVEVNKIKQRVQEAVNKKRARGERISRRPPMGHKFYMGKNEKGHFKQMVQIDPYALTVSGYIVHMRKAARYSFAKIAQVLNERGVKGPNEKRWNSEIASRYYIWATEKNLTGDPSWQNMTCTSTLLSTQGNRVPRQRESQQDQSVSSTIELTQTSGQTPAQS